MNKKEITICSNERYRREFKSRKTTMQERLWRKFLKRKKMIKQGRLVCKQLRKKTGRGNNMDKY